MLFLRHSPSGSKIDFPAYARSGSHFWDDLLNGKVTEAPELRVGLRTDNYYLGEFQDDTVWQSLRAASPDIDEHVSLYMRKDKIPLRLQRLLDNKQGPLATISIKSINGSHQKKQFEITQVHQLNWLTLRPK